MSQTIKTLSLVVPAFNEEEIIEQTINVYQKELGRVVSKYEIIVVDDGSTDFTPQILKKLKSENNKIKVFTHTKNMGVGKALIDGFKKAKYEWVMHNSADRAFHINDISKIKSLFKTSDVIVAVRHDRSANIPLRKITSIVSFILVKLLFGTSIKDFHFIQIYKRSLFLPNKTSVLSEIKSNDTFMPAELLVNLYRRGFKISQFEAKFYKRTGGYSKYNNPIRYLTYLRELIIFWWRLNIQQK